MTYQDFLNALGQQESSGDYSVVNQLGYIGKYQFGESALIAIGYYVKDGTNKNDWTGSWTVESGVSSKAEFLSNPAVQEAAISAYMIKQWGYLNSVKQYEGQELNGVKITLSGMLAGAHLVGQKAEKEYLNSGGDVVPKDGNGITVTQYIQQFAGYDTPFKVNHNVAETINGGSGNDVLNGLNGDDSLTGNDGNDTLIGGNDNDTLIGSNGDDTYIINVNSDVITENKNEGNDTLQLAGDNINNSKSLNYKYVETLKVLNSHTLPLKVELNQLNHIALSKNADDFTLHLNQYRPLPTDVIKIDTGAGADTIKLTPYLDVNSGNISLPSNLNFTDLSSDDKIDLSAFHIKSVVSTSINIPAIGDDYYVVKPSVSIVAGGTIAFFNSTTDWQIVEILNKGVSPEHVLLSGNITTSSFVI